MSGPPPEPDRLRDRLAMLAIDTLAFIERSGGTVDERGDRLLAALFARCDEPTVTDDFMGALAKRVREQLTKYEAELDAECSAHARKMARK